MPGAVKRLRAKGYGCLSDIDIGLTALHAFIGPNDSGKSTILRAVRTILHLASDKFIRGERQGELIPFDPDIPKDGKEYELEVSITDEVSYHVRTDMGHLTEMITLKGKPPWKTEKRNWLQGTKIPIPDILPPDLRPGIARLKGARLVRFDPDALREPSFLIPQENVIHFFDDRGMGLPGVYDAIHNRGDEAFQEIVQQLRRLFPTVKRLRLNVTSDREKAIEIELQTGERVPAQFMSEGMLFFLAFAALSQLEPTSVLLVEEPENGLHPARIRDVMQVLRDISNDTQVLIATHSPLVINELQGHEVTVLTRDPKQGTQAHLLSETPNFEERKKVYALGELWLSYANGDDEAPLLSGSDNP